MHPDSSKRGVTCGRLTTGRSKQNVRVVNHQHKTLPWTPLVPHGLQHLGMVLWKSCDHHYREVASLGQKVSMRLEALVVPAMHVLHTRQADVASCVSSDTADVALLLMLLTWAEVWLYTGTRASLGVMSVPKWCRRLLMAVHQLNGNVVPAVTAWGAWYGVAAMLGTR